MKTTCFTCKIKFNKPQCHIKRVKHVFCSKHCYDLYQRRFRIEKKCIICETPFFVQRCYVARYSTCENKKCRQRAKQNENNPNWKGGFDKSNKNFRAIKMTTAKYKRWRKSVFERDKYTCQDCGAKNGCGYKIELHAHHIKSWTYFPKLRYCIPNGKTLCKDCHENTYKNTFKRKNKNGKQ